MITNDIVGGAIGSNGRRDPNVLRCFSEGVPSTPKNADSRPARTVVGSDNDAPSRQVARYLAARADRSTARASRCASSSARTATCAAAITSRSTTSACRRSGSPSRTRTTTGSTRTSREEGGRKFGDRFENVDVDYVRARRPGERGGDLRGRARAGIAQAGADGHDEAHAAHHAALGEERRGGSRRLRRPLPHDARADLDAPPRGRRRMQTEVTLEGLSKDDWLFAVEAFDDRGHRSVPVYPLPQMR